MGTTPTPAARVTRSSDCGTPPAASTYLSARLELRTEPLLADPVTGFGSRRALLAHLDRAVDPASRPSVVAVFGLCGIEEFDRFHGAARGDKVTAQLADDLVRTVRLGGGLLRTSSSGAF